jgi:hypothetical protein
LFMKHFKHNDFFLLLPVIHNNTLSFQIWAKIF